MGFRYWIFSHSHPSRTTTTLQPSQPNPSCPRTSPLLTSLTLSQQTIRLIIITFPAESCGTELIISAENNTNHLEVTASTILAGMLSMRLSVTRR